MEKYFISMDLKSQYFYDTNSLQIYLLFQCKFC